MVLQSAAELQRSALINLCAIADRLGGVVHSCSFSAEYLAAVRNRSARVASSTFDLFLLPWRSACREWTRVTCHS